MRQVALLATLAVGSRVVLSPPRGDLIARRSTAARKRVLATRCGTNWRLELLGFILGTS